jgi:desampylase
MWVMNLRISRDHHRQLLKWAKKAHPLECCGLLLGEADFVSSAILTTNVALEPRRHFEINPSQLIAAEREAREGGPKILGYFHSHPNSARKPSNKDASLAATDGRYWLIIADTKITCWQAILKGHLHGRFNSVPLEIVDAAKA